MGLLAWIGRLWANLRGHPQAGQLSLVELLSLLQSEVERGIDAGSRRTADGTVVEVTSVDIEVPLGLAVGGESDARVERGRETGDDSGMTTRVDLDLDSGGGDGKLTVRYRPNPGTTAEPKRATELDDSQENSEETPLEVVENVTDAGKSTVAEATDATEGDAKRLVDFATAASLGATHDTARVLAALQLGIDDLASTTPVELLSTIEDGVESGAVSVGSTYEADVRELATVARNAERAVDGASSGATDSDSGDDG